MARAELDHLFLFVPDEETAQSMMARAGLRVNYARAHPGQGTRNLCACLDDVFLELLWLDGSPISDESERITLGLRGRGTGSPLGISWRGLSPFEEDASGVEPYRAPFLPSGASIPVARASLDPSVPFVFRTPGGVPPIERTDGLAGDRQAPDLTTLAKCTVFVQNPEIAREVLAPFDRLTIDKGAPGFRLHALRPDGVIGRTIDWFTGP